MKYLPQWVFAFVLSCLIMLIVYSYNYNNKAVIKAFVTQRNDVATNIDKKTFIWESNGPYWATKNRSIYEVHTREGHEYWFRFGGWFGYDVEERVGNAKYLKIK